MLAPLIVVAFLFQASPPDAEIRVAQSLVDAGKLAEAEQTLRTFLEVHNDSAEAQYLLGFVLLKENNPKSSLEQYSAAGRLKPPSALDLQAIGADYFLLEDYATADKWFVRSKEQNPGDAVTLYFLGRTRYNLQRFADAASLFQDCLRIDPKNAKAQEYLGLAQQQLGNTDAAVAALRAAADLRATPTAPFHLGRLLLDLHRAPEAVPYLKEAASLSPQDARVHRELGKAYLQTGQFEKAQTELAAAIRLDPQNAPAHFLLAQVLQHLDKKAEARAESDRYAALSAGHSTEADTLSQTRSLVQENKFTEAENLIRAYLTAHPNSADAHYLLGYTLFKEQKAQASLAEYTQGAKFRIPTALDFETIGADYVLLRAYADADKWFTKSVELDPKNVDALYYLGRTKYNENLFEQAIAAFNACLKLDAHHVRAEDNLGLAYQGLGQTAEAEKAYRTAIEWQQAGAAEEEVDPFINLGALLVDTDRAKEAVSFLEKATSLAPGDATAHRILGKAFMAINQLEKAQSELELSARLAPNNAPIHFILAQLYRKRGLLDKAKSETEQYAALAAERSISDGKQ